MAESLKTILMSALTSKATPAESDTLIVTSTIGWALSIVVNGIAVYNPWFRMVNAWQSLHYAFIVKGSKLEINLYTDILIQIADGVKTSIAFTRLS